MADTHYWKSAAVGNANNASNWNTAVDGSGSDGVPASTDDVDFRQGGACSFNIGMVASFAITSGYENTITMANSLLCTSSFTMDSSTATFSTASGWLVTTLGDFTQSAGTISGSYNLLLTMSGVGKTITLLSTTTVSMLTITGNTQTSSTFTVGGSYGGIDVRSGKTLWNNGTITYLVLGTLTNSGTIAGSGLFVFAFTSSKTLTFGVINCPVKVTAKAGSSGNFVATLGTHTSFGSTLSVISDSASTIALVAGASNYRLSVAGLTTIGVRSTMTQGTGNWMFNGGLITVGPDTTPTLTQNGNIWVNGTLTHNYGIINGKAGAWIYCFGDFINGQFAFFAANPINVVMNGGSLSPYAGRSFSGLTIAQSTTLTATCAVSYLTVNAGCTLSINTGKTLTVKFDTGAEVFTNSGTIAGAGEMDIRYTIVPVAGLVVGDVDCYTVIVLRDTATASRTVLLGGDAAFGGALRITSGSATYTMTVDMAGYDISSTTLTLTTRTILMSSVGGSDVAATTITVSATCTFDATNIGRIAFTGAWDTSAGAYTPGGAVLDMNGATQTIKTASGVTIGGIEMFVGQTVTLLSNIRTTDFNNLGTVTVGAFAFTWVNGWVPNFTTSPTLDGQETAAYSYTVAVNNSMALTAVSKPAWATFVAGTGVLSGTPTSSGAGTYAVSFSVTMWYQRTVWQNFTLTIKDSWSPTYTDAPGSMSTVVGQVTQTYTFDFNTNESATFRISWNTCTFPVSIDPATGVLTAQPMLASVGSGYQLGVSALSVSGIVETHRYFLMDVRGLWSATFTSAALESGVENALYDYSITLNETNSLDFSSSAAFLSLVGSHIQGTPSIGEDGTYTVTIRATSTIGLLDSWQNYTVTVIQTWAPSFTSAPILTGVEGVAYLYSITTNTSTTMSAILGANFLSLVAGEIGGMPLSGSAGDYDISIAINSTGTRTAWQNFTITISIPPLTGILNWNLRLDLHADVVSPLKMKYTYEFKDADNVVIADYYAAIWNFGDGNGSKGDFVVHQYERSGIYLVTCMVFDIDGHHTRSVKIVEVGDQDVPTTFVEDENAWWNANKSWIGVLVFIGVMGSVLVYAALAKRKGVERRQRVAVVFIALIMMIAVLTAFGSG